MRPARAGAAGASLLGAGLVYLVTEGVSAAAWARPKYSYAFNWISDLGAPIRGAFAGRQINSPLHELMNLGFTASGWLFLAGALLLAAHAQRVGRRAYLACAAVHALGMVLIAVVPETTARPLGNLHRLGALLAIGGGNLGLVAGSVLVPPRRLGAVLGFVGLASLAFLVLAGAALPTFLGTLGAGIVERASVYPITAWEIIAGAALLAQRSDV